MTSEFVPIGTAIAADIRDVKCPGLLLPLRQHDPAMLLTNWDGKIHAIMLTGPNDFMFFDVKIDHSKTGLFVPDVEILIDFSSAEKSAGYEQRLGDLLLEKNKLSIIGGRIGDGFRDPQPVPLWPAVAGGSQSAKVAFTRWALGVRSGEGFHQLWVRNLVSETTIAVL